MPLSIETLRVRIGLQAADNSRDDEINAAIKAAMALAEAYCNRKFLLAHDNETFTHISGGTASLRRYPVTRIVSLDAVNGDSRSYHLESLTGLIHFDGNVHDHELRVQYDGGYFIEGLHDPVEFPGELVEMPEDLLFAILQVFDNVFRANSGGGGVAAGTIESVSLTGVGTIRYATGADAVASGGADNPMIGQAAGILGLYRREYC